MTKTVSARVNSSLHTKLCQVCNESGKTVNEYLNEIIDKSLNGHSEANSEPESKEFEEKIRDQTLQNLRKELGLEPKEKPKDEARKILDKFTEADLNELIRNGTIP